MMEFKFKAWDKYQKMWVGKDIAIGGKGTVFIVNLNSSIRQVEDIEVVWWTGHKDCKGVELFQGDILKVVRGGTLQVCHEVIKWGEYGWLPWEYEAGDSYYRLGDIEKIGNIFETPELLKETNERD